MLTHLGTQTIETQRLILRQFQYDDDETMLKYWIADEKIQSLYSEPVYTTKAEVKTLLDKYITSYAKEDYYRWAVIEKESKACIGQIAYFLVDNKNHFAEIEYCIGSEFQCRGFATEMTKAIIQYGFEKINLHKVQICTKTINKPSQRVIEKCGFKYEGTLRDYFYMNQQYVGRLYYSLLRSEYESPLYHECVYELATQEDLKAIYELVQTTIKTIYPLYYPTEVVDFFCAHHQLAQIESDIANGYVSVLKIKGQIVGTGSFVDNHITRVYIDPRYQKRGYGTFIIQALEAAIKQKHDQAILDASLPAASLYETLGYKTLHHAKRIVEHHVVLTYEVMTKDLHRINTNK